MGTVGRDLEKGVQGVAKPLGLTGKPQVGSGGAFAVTDAARTGENDVLNALTGKINGTGEYITDLQFKQAMDDLIKQQQSATASARGVSNAGLLQRNALQQGAQTGMDLARESAAAKLQEQQQAQQMILNQASAQRGVAAGAAGANLVAQTAQQKNMQDIIGKAAGAASSVGGGTAPGGAPATATSDENLKENITESKGDASKVISEFLDALKSHTYEYKNSKDNGQENPKGEVTSVMAQELEKSPVGKRAVKEGPDGKSVDYAQLMAPMLASMAEINKRLKKLE